MVKGCLYFFLIMILASLVVVFFQTFGPLLLLLGLIAGAVFLLYKLYETIYFHSKEFVEIKTSIFDHINDCNALNEHIEELKLVDLGVDQTRYGMSDYHDSSRWNFSRPELKKIRRASNVCECTRNVCDNSRKNPMQYVCKYFGFKVDEETLEKFENMLNDFTAVEDGKKSLVAQKAEILESISSGVPGLIRKFSEKRLWKELGFEEVDLSDAYYPSFQFQYVSSGGNASTENTITMDIDNLNAMVNYLNDRIKWKKSVAGQRALMTSSLRQGILDRDHHTCQQCGVSVQDEPHLLLEVDHIIPVSKGGLTAIDNLQTLCWRCNRSKGAKVVV